MKNKDAINIAIIGTADEGPSLVKALGECPSINIVGLLNPGLKSSNTPLVKELNVLLFDRIEQLPSIGDVDLIIDASGGDIDIEAVEELSGVEVIRGKSADIIKHLAEREKSNTDDLEAIFSTAFDFAAKQDSQSIYRAIVDTALKLTGCTVGSLVIFNERTETCQLAELVGYSKNVSELTWELQPGGITEQLLDQETPLFIQDINNEPLFDNPVMNEGTISVLATALKEADEVIGLLFIGDFKTRKFSERDITLFSSFAGTAALALQKALLIEKAQELTTTDLLTGLNNEKHFFATLDTEMQRAQRYGGGFSVILIDMDNIGYINDYFGRTKGDWVLKKVADIIRDCSRQTDYKARYGGDEFAMILPNADCSQASVLANRIRRQVNDTFIEDGENEARLSVSIGIAQFPCLGTNCDDLLSAVNTALYISKQRGRNLVCCYEDTGQPAESS